MKTSIFSALKRLALVATVSRLDRRVEQRDNKQNYISDKRVYVIDAADEMLFDVRRTEVQEHTCMLSGQMDRLSGSLGRVRELLSAVSAKAPIYNEVADAPTHAPFHEDPMLFEGEAAFVGSRTDLEGDIAELFEDVVPASEPRVAIEVSQAA